MTRKPFLILSIAAIFLHPLSPSFAMEDNNSTKYGTVKKVTSIEMKKEDVTKEKVIHCHWGLEHWWHGVKNILFCKTNCDCDATDENPPSVCGALLCPYECLDQIIGFPCACMESDKPTDGREHKLPYKSCCCNNNVVYNYDRSGPQETFSADWSD